MFEGTRSIISLCSSPVKIRKNSSTAKTLTERWKCVTVGWLVFLGGRGPLYCRVTCRLVPLHRDHTFPIRNFNGTTITVTIFIKSLTGQVLWEVLHEHHLFNFHNKNEKVLFPFPLICGSLCVWRKTFCHSHTVSKSYLKLQTRLAYFLILSS